MRETLRKLRDYGGHIKALIALACLMLAGALLGAALTSAYYRDSLERESVVNRGMYVALTVKMDVIAKRLDGTASTQAAAAGQLKETTTAVNEVVDKVDAAADKADKVAKAVIVQAAKVAKAAPQPAPAVQPEVVNREIRMANEKLKERPGK